MGNLPTMNMNLVSDIPTDKIFQEQITDYQEAFAVFDHDGDGTISVQELEVVLRSLGQNPTQAELDDMVRDADDDGNGKIDFAEFLTMVMQLFHESKPEREIKHALRIFDKDGDEQLTTEELRHVLMHTGKGLSTDDVERVIETTDPEGKGFVRFEDFLKLSS